MQTPSVVARSPSSLSFTWNPPTQPNGVITSYKLFLSGLTVFSGTAQSAVVTNLTPFTVYKFHLEACTAAGCSNSSIGSNITLSDSPAGVAPPTLTALSPTSIRAMWTTPTTPNGIITSYSLVRVYGSGLSEEEVIFTGLQLEAVAMNLTANTLYFFKVVASTDGGSTASSAANITTPEDIPDCISPPSIVVTGSSSLNISWQVPCEPNGVIISYNLIQDGTQIFSGLQLNFLVTGLEPFTMYSFTIMACTTKGCGSSSPATGRTAEAIPEGYREPTVTDTQANMATIVINEVDQPNGVVQYTLRVSGEFLLAVTPPGGVRTSSVETRVVFSDGEVGTATVNNLVPFSQYQAELEVSNSAGSLVGTTFTFMTTPAGD